MRASEKEDNNAFLILIFPFRLGWNIRSFAFSGICNIFTRPNLVEDTLRVGKAPILVMAQEAPFEMLDYSRRVVKRIRKLG